ncbi:MAG: hydroxyphenylacetyl-CoA thioesterase PaaI [Aigarchaeota archaeon]|nr:hydroxyphenylacetyl-CoA thioesterase PaaI [Candidatus Pelearchaeum maunauluense]
MEQDVPESLVAKFRSDPFLRYLGVRITEVRRGYCRAEMKVGGDMLNFHGVAHGGAIFTLADAAFAVASNSHGTRAVALMMDIAFRHPAMEGDELVAEATETSLGRRTALYYITVRKTDGTLVASCQGMVFRSGESIENTTKE